MVLPAPHKRLLQYDTLAADDVDAMQSVDGACVAAEQLAVDGEDIEGLSALQYIVDGRRQIGQRGVGGNGLCAVGEDCRDGYPVLASLQGLVDAVRRCLRRAHQPAIDIDAEVVDGGEAVVGDVVNLQTVSQVRCFVVVDGEMAGCGGQRDIGQVPLRVDGIIQGLQQLEVADVGSRLRVEHLQSLLLAKEGAIDAILVEDVGPGGLHDGLVGRHLDYLHLLNPHGAHELTALPQHVAVVVA